MSNQHPPPQTPPANRPPAPEKRYIKIVQHSQLFYWWPVWLIGFVLGLISLFGGERMAAVSEHSRIKYVPADQLPYLASDSKLKDVKDALLPEPKKGEAVTGAYVVVSPEKESKDSPLAKAEQNQKDGKEPFTLHVSGSKSLGVIWALTLVLVIFITNVPLRGMWSVVILVSAILLSIIFILLGWWEALVAALQFLDIRINTAGYFFVSFVLFLFWAITVFLFDQQTYWIFTPGQLRIHEAIGGGEKAFDTRGMTTEKHRDDLFRHWILGLGTGDLTVRTAGAETREFRIQNVWWVGHKLSQIQDMQREHQMIAAPGRA